MNEPLALGELDNDNEDDNDKRSLFLLRIFVIPSYLTFYPSWSQGKDGKACVLKAICKAAGRRREDVGKGSFLEETLHAIFT